MIFSPSAFFIFIILFIGWMFGGHWITVRHSGAGDSRAAFKYLQYGLLATALLIPFLTAWVDRSITRLAKSYHLKKATEYVLWIFVSSLVSYYIEGGQWIFCVLVGAFFASQFSFNQEVRWRETIISLKTAIWWLARIVISLTLLWVSYQNRWPPVFDLYDDGPRLSAVSQFMLGRIPHKEIFIHYGILREVVQPLLAFQIWGVSYDSIIRLSQAMMAMNYVLLFWICTELSESILVALGVGLVLMMRMDLFLPERVFFLLLAVYFLMAAFRKFDKNLLKQNIFLFIGGFFTLGTCLYSLEIGITLFVGVSMALGFALILGPRNSSSVRVGKCFFGGIFTGCLLYFFWLVYAGAVGHYFSDLYSLLFNRMETWAGGTRSHLFGSVRDFFIKPQLRSTLLYLNFPVFLSLGAITGVCICSLKDSLSGRVNQILILASVLFVQFTIYIGRPDYIHWQNATSLQTPLMLLVAMSLYRWAESNDRDRMLKFLRLLSIGFLVVPLFIYFLGRSPLISFFVRGYERIQFSTPPLPQGETSSIPRVGFIPLSNEQKIETTDIIRTIKNTIPVEGYFFDFTNLGGFYFLAERRNPTRFGLINYISSPAMLEECAQSLARHPPDGILVELDHDRWICRKDLDPLARSLQESFVLGQRIGRFGLFVPLKKAI